MTPLRLRLTAGVLVELEMFLTDRGADGAEGTGLIAAAAGADDWWEAAFFLAPDQRAVTEPYDCSVEVTDTGKDQLVAALPAGHLYLARAHSHPGEAFHSRTDDANPALTHLGSLSIVVPYFGLGLRRGLDACAVYRHEESRRWQELPPGAQRRRWLVGPDG